MNTELENSYKPLLIKTEPRPEMTFESFVTCRANEFPAEVAKTLAEGHTPAYNPLFIYSDVGLGKTHLLYSIVNEVNRIGEASIAIFNAVDLEAELERADRIGRRAELRDWLIKKDVLLIDDVQFCESSESFQKELFAIISGMTSLNKRVAITCDVPPTRLRGIEKRLISRLGGGVIVSLQMADLNARIEILRRTAAEAPIDEDVYKYLAERIDDNVRRLKAAVYQLLVHHRETGVEINIELTRAIIPMPEDLAHGPAREDEARGASGKRSGSERETSASGIDRFKKMLQSAENEREQALALQIAIGERIRQLRGKEENRQTLEKLNNALSLLRAGELKAAVEFMAEIGGD